jgi:hypothetical protein
LAAGAALVLDPGAINHRDAHGSENPSNSGTRRVPQRFAPHCVEPGRTAKFLGNFPSNFRAIHIKINIIFHVFDLNF